MSIFSFLRKKKHIEAETQKQEEDAISVGIAQSIEKKEKAYEENPAEIPLEDYTPSIALEEPLEETILQENRSIEACRQILEENCKQLQEQKTVHAHAKIAYQAVTEYLSDLQKIQRMPQGEKELLVDTAKKIVELTEEKDKHKQRRVTGHEMSYRSIQKKEHNIMQELKQMREQEDYQRKINQDLRQLQAEKAALTYDYEHLPGRQLLLKKIAISVAAIAGSLCVLFYIISVGAGADIRISFMMTVAMVAGVMAYVFLESDRNRREHMEIGVKINRAIQLSNKVKIKYINNRSGLDYAYSKYQVKNSLEFENVIKQYFMAKEEERTYESNMERLQHYRNKLLDLLAVQEVNDTEIWLHQLSAFLQEEEFQRLQDNLEQRRNSLVEKMDENATVRDYCFEQMDGVVVEYPELKQELIALLSKYEISFQ